MWDNVYQLLVSAGVGAGMAVGVIAYFGKRLIERQFSREAERYRNELAAKSDALKTELAIYAHEHKLAASRIDTQKAEAIRHLFGALCRWSLTYVKIKGLPPMRDATPNKRYEQWKNSVLGEYTIVTHEIINEILQYSIYVEKDTFDEILTLINKTSESGGKINNALFAIQAAEEPTSELVKELQSALAHFVSTFEHEFMPKFTKLMNKLREAAGIFRNESIE